MDNWGLWSTFTFPTLIFPSYSFDNSSITGPMARQGPHHSAQKSITVNFSDAMTFSWKFASVNSKAIMYKFKLYVKVWINLDSYCRIYDIHKEKQKYVQKPS